MALCTNTKDIIQLASVKPTDDVDAEKNPFTVLPSEMLAEIFTYFHPKYRQQLRAVSRFWKYVVDTYYGICLNITNVNWNWVEDCNCAKSIILNGFSRDIINPEIIARRLTRLEISDFAAYYSFMPLLEKCDMLQTLEINCVAFLQKSRLPEYTTSEYLERKGKGSWLPRLLHFKFTSCTTQGGVYNHLIPSDFQDEIYGLEDVSRSSCDISRGEMEFLPFILQILTRAKSLKHVEMTLTDIWKIPFSDIFQIKADSTHPSLDVSLWHFGSKRLLPVNNLLEKPNSITSLKFNFPYHFDTFFMKFKPISREQQDRNLPAQLEDVVVHQSFRWSQETSQVDIPWLQILEKQYYLKTLEYPFPIYGNDSRMAVILAQNSKTLQKIVFTGHREERDQMENLRAGRQQPWDAEWFSCCENLEELSLKTSTRFLLIPAHISTIENLGILPQSLKHFTFHGCIDTRNYPLSNAFYNMVNLESFTHQARLCPWFKVEGASITKLQISHVMDVIMSLPKLNRWTFEWYDTCSTIAAHSLLNFPVPRQTAGLSNLLRDWMESAKNNFELHETFADRQLKSLKVNILSRSFIDQ